jgi:hypothetical protein
MFSESQLPESVTKLQERFLKNAKTRMPFSIVHHKGSHNTRVSKNTQKRLTFNSTKEDEVSSSRDETGAGGDDDVEEEEQSTGMGLSRRSWTEPKLMHCRSNP